jgi:hypothetical protein
VVVAAGGGVQLAASSWNGVGCGVCVVCGVGFSCCWGVGDVAVGLMWVWCLVWAWVSLRIAFLASCLFFLESLFPISYFLFYNASYFVLVLATCFLPPAPTTTHNCTHTHCTHHHHLWPKSALCRYALCAMRLLAHGTCNQAGTRNHRPDSRDC